MLALIGRRHGLYERGALTGFKCADVGLDADLSELLLQELNNLLGGRVVVARPEIDREAAAVAGFLQKFAGLLRIIGPGAEFLGEIDGGRSVARGRISVARKSDFAERFLINGIVEGFADALVLEGLLRHVHFNIAKNDGGGNVEANLILPLNLLDLFGGQRESKLCFAREKHRNASAVLNDRLPVNGIEFREPCLPVARVLHDAHAFARIVFVERVGTGAAGFESDLFIGLISER